MHLLALLLGCGELSQSVTIPFSAEVSGEPFACGESYAGLGTTAATISPQDFRVYVHDVALIDASGAAVPVTLDEDGAWQHEGLALLDFEDGSAGCKTGSPDTHTELTGTVPRGDYTGLSFTVGVPDAMNHLDAATAPAPLNAPGMWWAWTSGFKFARIDGATDDNPAFYFHLGATSCSGSPDSRPKPTEQPASRRSARSSSSTRSMRRSSQIVSIGSARRASSSRNARRQEVFMPKRASVTKSVQPRRSSHACRRSTSSIARSTEYERQRTSRFARSMQNAQSNGQPRER